VHIIKFGRRHNRGITFVEVLVSVLILAITLGAMLTAFLIGRFSAEKSKHYAEALNHARAAMEELIDDQSAVPVLPAGDISDLGGFYTWSVTPRSADLQQILVTVTWQERALGFTSPVSVQLFTYVEN
jgi:type II secretory pathway pseudopilin PulG